MLTVSCRICGNAKPPSEYSKDLCNECGRLRSQAENHYASEHPNAAQSDILYAGRQALNQRAHHAHRNFIDPRDFSTGHGMIPIPPPSNRGSTT